MGSIPVNGFGYIYVVADEGNIGNIEMHEDGFTLIGGGGIHFAKEPRDDFSPDMYWAVSRWLGRKYNRERYPLFIVILVSVIINVAAVLNGGTVEVSWLWLLAL